MKKLLNFLFLLFIGTSLIFCTEKQEEATAANGPSYTCPMHPQIVQTGTG